MVDLVKLGLLLKLKATDLCKGGMFFIQVKGGRECLFIFYFKSFTELAVVGPSHAVGCCCSLDSLPQRSQNAFHLSVPCFKSSGCHCCCTTLAASWHHRSRGGVRGMSEK